MTPSNVKRRFLGRRGLAVVVGIALLLGACTTLAWLAASSAPPPAHQRMAACQKGLSRALPVSDRPMDRHNGISSACYRDVRAVYRLEQAAVGSESARFQQFQSVVMLWMVVAVTLAGVTLAGLQLLGAYRLAIDGKGVFQPEGEVSLERDRISLKSSVTGLLILTVSFAFFFVYVLWVYTVDPPGSEQRQSDKPPTVDAGLLKPTLQSPGPGPDEAAAKTESSSQPAVD